MKLAAILGSPHGMKGNTAAVLKSVMNAVSAEGALTETFSLTDYTIHPCKGCATCSKTGTCIIDDDFATILNKGLAIHDIVMANTVLAKSQKMGLGTTLTFQEPEKQLPMFDL